MITLKVCGIRRAEEVDRAAAGGADFIGLWYRVPGGRHDLHASQVTFLAARGRRHGVAPVLVTLSHDASELAELIGRAEIGHLQLHAYQSPALVRRLAEHHAGLTIFKVLHVDAAGDCVEQPLIGAYERAGVGGFLIDRVAAGRLGSTGLPVDPASARALAERCSVPVWLAGGVGADASPADAQSSVTGIDIDGAARDSAGSIATERVAGVARAWRTRRHPAAPPTTEPTSEEIPR